VTSARVDDEYLVVLEEAVKTAGDTSPFTGKLNRAQIIRLQR
jgi:hypothetical protein